MMRLAPAGNVPSRAAWVRLFRDPHEAADRLRAGLRAIVPDTGSVRLHRSGREALRVIFAEAAARSGRPEVVLPGYTCFSVAAAAVAAGLRVRLVDVDERGRIDRNALSKLPLERAAAVVVCNLFGVAEPVHDLASPIRDAGAWLIDDAAQSLGAEAADGRAGARGDVGVLSFGRGKPLAAMAGGASLWRVEPPRDASAEPVPSRTAGVAAALAGTVALWPPVFTTLAAIPALHVGETPFEPAFARGAITPGALALAAALVDDVLASGRARGAVAAGLARRIEAASRFTALAPRGDETCVAPRCALFAPDAPTRDAALRGLREIGAGESALYPTALDAVPGLAPHRVAADPLPGARALAARLLTLPSHGRLRGERLDRVVALLRALAPSHERAAGSSEERP